MNQVEFLRRSGRLTQADLAALAGVGQVDVSRAERGIATPEVVGKIERALAANEARATDERPVEAGVGA